MDGRILSVHDLIEKEAESRKDIETGVCIYII